MNFFITSPFEHFGLIPLLSNYTYINNLHLLYINIIYLCIIYTRIISDTGTYSISNTLKKLLYSIFHNYLLTLFEMPLMVNILNKIQYTIHNV